MIQLSMMDIQLPTNNVRQQMDSGSLDGRKQVHSIVSAPFLSLIRQETKYMLLLEHFQRPFLVVVQIPMIQTQAFSNI